MRSLRVDTPSQEQVQVSEGLEALSGHTVAFLSVTLHGAHWMPPSGECFGVQVLGDPSRVVNDSTEEQWNREVMISASAEGRDGLTVLMLNKHYEGKKSGHGSSCL